MASIYLQPKSQFYWLKWTKPDGTVARFSTKLSRLKPADVRRARQMEAEYTLKERSFGSSGGSGSLAAWLWVPQFLKTAYYARPTTLHRYLGVWNNLSLFLREREIVAPAQFTREHCFDYMTWRAQPDKKHGKYEACHNTALMELKTLRIILNEAVVRGHCTGNPCVKLKIAKEKSRSAPELTNAQLDDIREAISQVADPKLREFYEITFDMARWQGCRINATRLNPLLDVTITGQTGTIRFVSKGKDFVTMLHPRLIPLFTRLKEARRAITWSVPAQVKNKDTWASLQWTNFFTHRGFKSKIPGICHRSFRVSVVTRMARNNVPESKAKEFVKHASTTVHRVYQRLIPEDLADCAKAIE